MSDPTCIAVAALAFGAFLLGTRMAKRSIEPVSMVPSPAQIRAWKRERNRLP